MTCLSHPLELCICPHASTYHMLGWHFSVWLSFPQDLQIFEVRYHRLIFVSQGLYLSVWHAAAIQIFVIEWMNEPLSHLPFLCLSSQSNKLWHTTSSSMAWPLTEEFLGCRLFFSYLNLLLPRSEATGSDGQLIHTEVLSHFIIQILIELLLCSRHCAKVCVSH